MNPLRRLSLWWSQRNRDERFALLALAAIVLILALSGCTPPSVFLTQTRGGTVLEVPGASCPVTNDPSGCALKVDWAVFYPLDADDRAHELDHTEGLVHGEWSPRGAGSCATVVAGGLTHWHAGELLCKGPSGHYAKEGTGQ